LGVGGNATLVDCTPLSGAPRMMVDGWRAIFSCSWFAESGVGVDVNPSDLDSDE
jgi:uncharacterized protein YodC (DUF2158 family)